MKEEGGMACSYAALFLYLIVRSLTEHARPKGIPQIKNFYRQEDLKVI